MFAHRNSVHPALLALPAIYFHTLFLVATAFAIHNSYNHPVSDAFYHIKTVVIPHHDHALTLSTLFATRGPANQPHVLYKLFLLVNYHLFNLDFRIELPVGILGIYLSSRLLLSSLEGSLASAHTILAVATQISVITKLVSFNADQHFLWSLVTFDYCLLALSFLLFCFAGRLALERPSPIPYYLVAFLTLLFGSTTGELAVMAVAVGLIVITLTTKDNVLLGHGLVTFLLVVVFKAATAFSQHSPGPQGLAHFNSLLSLGALKFVLYLLGQGLLSADHYKNAVSSDFHYLSLAAGLVMIILNIYALRIYFKDKIYRTTMFPLFLLLFGYGLLFALLWGRFVYFGAEYAFQPRYVRVAEVNAIGLLWVYGLRVTRGLNRVRKAAYLIFTVVLVLVHVLLIPPSFKRSPWIIRYHKAEEREIRALANDEIQTPTMPRINVHGAREVAKFLREQRLSLFDGDF